MSRLIVALRASAVVAVLSVSVNRTAVAAEAAEVVVYGGTSGGAIAAVQCARMAKSVILIEPGRHLGGPSSGGLYATNTDHPDGIGGRTRRHRRVRSAVGPYACLDFACVERASNS